MKIRLKHLLSCAVVVSMFSLTSCKVVESESASLRLSVKGVPSDEIKSVYYDDAVRSAEGFHIARERDHPFFANLQMQVKPDGFFKDFFGYIQYKSNGKAYVSAPLYLPDGGGKLVMALDKGGDRWGFKGMYAKENDFMAKNSALLFPSVEWSDEFGVFKAHLDSLDSRIVVVLAEEGKDLDKDFLARLQKELKYSRDYTMLRYPKAHAYFTKKEMKHLPSYERAEAFTKAFSANALATIDYRYYTEMCDYIKQQAVYKEMGKAKAEGVPFSYYKAMMDYAMETYTDKMVRRKMLSRAILSYLSGAGVDDYIKDIYMDFQEKYGVVENSALAKKYGKVAQLAPGNNAPNFTGRDASGKEVSLSDFKGKLVYIDVWATWCGPCRQEIPHLKTLEEKNHSNEEVVFMSVSIDEDADEDKWKDMIEEKELKGVQLRVSGGFNAKIVKQYQIQGIPRFMLIGKDGKIVDVSAPRPSSGEEIQELLNKNT